MKLTPRQIALFGQVKVNLGSIDSQLVKYVTLLSLYQDGWWVTDRFGTLITIVRPKIDKTQGFSCYVRRIATTINLNSLDEEIQKIADRKYEKYKNFLERKKIKVNKVNINENNMSTLPSGNNY